MKLQAVRVLLAVGALIAAATSSASVRHHDVDGCQMFPKNSLRFPVTFGAEETGISEKDFNTSLDAIEHVYQPEVQAAGARLKILRNWMSPEVNAGASRSPDGKTWMLHMFGGMARHPEMTNEGFLLVACHEMGHHLGLSPHYPGDAMASEGQADYYATLKCMRRTLALFKTAGQTRGLVRTAPRLATEACKRFQQKSFDGTDDGVAVCLRSHAAASTLGQILGEIINDALQKAGRKTLPIPKLSTPDLTVVRKTIVDDYPSPQCRLDTYSAGALCPIGVNTPLDAENPNSGVCLNPTSGAEGAGSQDSIIDKLGARPPCWYNQAEFDGSKTERFGRRTMIRRGFRR